MRICDLLRGRDVRPGSTRHDGAAGVVWRSKSQVGKYPVMVGAAVYWLPSPRASGFGPSRVANAMTAFRDFHGEFDPGSGRTLAACLTHASGATNQGLPWGRAANG